MEQLAAIFNVDMWDLIQSGKGGLVLQINEGDNNGDFSLYASNDAAAKIEMLKLELKHARDLLSQKDKEIELLRRLVESQG